MVGQKEKLRGRAWWNFEKSVFYFSFYIFFYAPLAIVEHCFSQDPTMATS